ncbi:hypothetical protein OEZ85_006500 [Tetradesmus obliquus]|uniref:Telomere length regulation protein conserved domain-containing protein n=1 Tax=Tetradesmus obliquus TaxID=3088 RepID=A0ABY8TUS2_TETOB|nr:hypothetical protein OEZ85_006500 [Tetradesmus obliquus]
MRLASPSPSIRAQAMRVGHGFAAKLDPAKPLFEEAGELPLLPDELWPGALDQQQQQQQQQHGDWSVQDDKVGNGHATASGEAASAEVAASSSKFGALQRLQEAALEADSDDEEDASTAAAAGRGLHGPQQQQQNGLKHHTTQHSIGASDADGADDDDDSASDAGSEGSASSLVAFDLAEEPAADAWWGPDGLGLPEGKQLSLRGLAAALRKQDDVNGALEALRRVEECDVRKHGVDLFGRDSLLLGRLLTVLGAFVEAAAATPAALPLSAGLLELVKAPQVSGHKEVFVRRAALVAASQVVRHLPPARLAGALVGRQQDAQDAVLVERLQWLTSWAQAVAAGDVDEHCRVLAAGCVAWHVELAEGAMAALEHLPQTEGPSLSTVARPGSRGSSRGLGQGVDIKVPSLQDRLVLQ